ncbi:MAG: hypothetical protein LBE86_15370 [Gemmobacter sp.]|jgi:hypothetical protein|nr:hypothetical protein [Gemmobacter sp.]
MPIGLVRVSRTGALRLESVGDRHARETGEKRQRAFADAVGLARVRRSISRTARACDSGTPVMRACPVGSECHTHHVSPVLPDDGDSLYDNNNYRNSRIL